MILAFIFTVTVIIIMVAVQTILGWLYVYRG